MRRVAIYIDGGPFTDAVRGQGMSMDMDIMALSRALAGEGEVVSVDYVAPEFPDFPYPTKARNEKARWRDFSSQGVNVHLCKPQTIGSVFIDRGVEGLMTAKLLTESAKFDCAVIVSRRVELGPALAGLRAMGKSVEVAYFEFELAPGNPLGQFADVTRVITMGDVVAVRRGGPKPPF